MWILCCHKNKLWKQDQSILNIPKVGDWPPIPCYPQQLNYGWICPKCGKVNAPHINSCNCSNITTITYDNGSNLNPAPSILVYEDGKFTINNKEKGNERMD